VLADRLTRLRDTGRARLSAVLVQHVIPHLDPVTVAASVHYVSTACIDAYRLDQPRLARRCRATCKHCGQRCRCGHAVRNTGATWDDLTTALQATQVDLWADLAEAVRHANVTPPVIPGHWSVRCEELAERLVDNARLVGPVGWPNIKPDLLLHGIYEKLLHDAGLQWAPVEWDHVLDLYDRHHPAARWVGPPVKLIGTIDPERPR
jgi:hypothetical protein